ncbi:helix-turn-helix domain-containing protein [Vibrio aestuarianus]
MESEGRKSEIAKETGVSLSSVYRLLKQ